MVFHSSTITMMHGPINIRFLNIKYKQRTNWQDYITNKSLCCHFALYTSFTHVQSVRNTFDKKFLNLTMNYDYVSLFLGPVNVVTAKLLFFNCPSPIYQLLSCHNSASHIYVSLREEGNTQSFRDSLIRCNSARRYSSQTALTDENVSDRQFCKM